jgi:Chaperone of endosialidase
MKSAVQLKTATPSLLITLALASLGLLPRALAVSPPPDGCYPNYTTAEGCNALQSLTTGAGNTGVGWRSLFSTMGGSYNTGVGAGALILNTADSNTAVGAAALLLNTSGTQNTAVGTDALVYNDADVNTAVGFSALGQNRRAFTNTALGAFAAANNDSSGSKLANDNVAVGGFALRANVNGTRNTALGAGAIEFGDGGNDNTAVGLEAGGNMSGNHNTAVGEMAGQSISGIYNTCLGYLAGSNLTGGEGGIYIGAGVQADSSGEREFIRIGNDTAFIRPYDTFIAGIYGRPVGPSPLTVLCGSNGKLTANPSSRRFKHDIKPMDNVSEAILALKPVTFRYNNDSTNTPWFGLIAEDVAEVSEDLIVRDKEGKPFGVRDYAINAMLLNEFIKEHKKVEEQQATISELKNEVQTVVAQLKEQAAQIQKVSAQVEVSKRMAQVAASSP